MKILDVLLIGLMFSVVLSVDPALWAESFTQDYLQVDDRAKVYSSAKLFYDAKNNRQRLDSNSSHFNLLCTSAGGANYSVACSQVFLNNSMYIYLPFVNKCCKCCSNPQYCSMKPRDWLTYYSYVGQQYINGEYYHKWFSGAGNTSFYNT